MMQSSRAWALFSIGCVLFGIAASDENAPPLGLYVPPAGLRPQAAPETQTKPEAPAMTPVAQPVAQPSFMMPTTADSPGQPFMGATPQYQYVPMAQPIAEGQSSDIDAPFFGGFAGGLLAGAAVVYSLLNRTGNIGARASVQSRVAPVTMYDISHHDDIWSLEAKREIYEKWDPEKPRDYFNFNPFERNDEGQQCDSNGCFPGQDGAYKPPNRPDVSWDLMQEHNKIMDALKQEAKFNIKGKPGCWKKGWADGLGPAP